MTDRLRLEKMDPAFDRILLDGDEKEYAIMQGYEAFELEMIRNFPEEKTAIRKYIETIELRSAKVFRCTACDWKDTR